jgi:hypothetical protein
MSSGRCLTAGGNTDREPWRQLMGSSQPRVAKLENRDPEVSLDLQMKAVFAASAEAHREFQGLVKKWSTRGAEPGTPPTHHLQLRLVYGWVRVPTNHGVLEKLRIFMGF